VDPLKLLSLAFLVTVAISCNSYHSGIYVYQSQVYSSAEFTDFNIKHYKNYGNTNFSIVLDSSEKNLEDQKATLEEQCKVKEIECSFVVIEEKIEDSKANIVENFEKYGKKKFYLYSPTSKGLAKYLGAVNLELHGGNERTLNNIFEGLKLTDTESLKALLLNAKN
jgi:hypothetical protein